MMQNVSPAFDLEADVVERPEVLVTLEPVRQQLLQPVARGS